MCFQRFTVRTHTLSVNIQKYIKNKEKSLKGENFINGHTNINLKSDLKIIKED